MGTCISAGKFPKSWLSGGIKHKLGSKLGNNSRIVEGRVGQFAKECLIDMTVSVLASLLHLLPSHLLQARYNEDAAESALLRPSFSTAMARPLYEVYARRLAVTGAAEREAPSRRRRHAGADPHADAGAQEPGTSQEAAMPQEGPHAAVQTPAADGAPAEFDDPPMGTLPHISLFMVLNSFLFCRTMAMS